MQDVNLFNQKTRAKKITFLRWHNGLRKYLQSSFANNFSSEKGEGWIRPPPFLFSILKRKKKQGKGGYFFLRVISLGRVVVPSPRTYKKLPCKGEPYRLRESLQYKQTIRQTYILLLRTKYILLNKVVSFQSDA